jgi:hypothetical protein
MPRALAIDDVLFLPDGQHTMIGLATYDQVRKAAACCRTQAARLAIAAVVREYRSTDYFTYETAVAVAQRSADLAVNEP